jgi:hypothetical protein
MRLRLKLRPRTVEDIECPLPVVKLRVRDRYGTLAALDFRVDTQADFTTIPIPTAEREGLPFSRDRERTAIGLVGETSTYRDRVRILIAGREHDWPCHFLKVPVSREVGEHSRDPLPALGRAGFLDEYAITVDSGYLIVTRIGPFRRWFRKWLHALWGHFGVVHPADQPL